MKEVAIIGIQGVPANYGGFESLVENIIGSNQSPGIHYTIYCSAKDMKQKISTYKGCDLRYVNLHANGMHSIPYDIISMCRSLRGFDTLLVLGTSGCLFLPVLRLLSRSRIVVNIDGLEHRRQKWGAVARTVLRVSEACAVKWAHTVIADNAAIQRYVTERYSKSSEMIAYGGDHVTRNVSEKDALKHLDNYSLKKGEYAISVCRIEPENNCHITLEAFAKKGQRLVFIGNWEHSQYSHDLKSKYKVYANLTLLDSVYDLDVLYSLRSNAGLYLHGHSAGGTNPSLVEAMHFGMPILAFDVDYNRETTFNKAYYFKTVEDLLFLLDCHELDGTPMIALAKEHYIWNKIARQYESLY